MNAKATTKLSRAARKPLWQFCLYVANKTPRSLLALANLRRFCDEQLPGLYQIEVIDVLAQPQVALKENIVALPMLVRKAPKPMRMVIGDLSNTPRVVAGLDVHLSA